MGNPGIMEYRGVYVQTGQEVFKVGPYHDGTNNIGEFLAIVHGLALLKQKGSNIPIYSDSKIAQKWVRDGKCRTTLAPTSRNAELLGLVARAEKWLATNTYTNPIIKWETKQWGGDTSRLRQKRIVPQKNFRQKRTNAGVFSPFYGNPDTLRFIFAEKHKSNEKHKKD